MQHHVLRLGRHVQFLANRAKLAGLCRWHIPPKMHAFQHLPEQCDLINSRILQAYMEESLIGRIAMIFKSCLNGPQSFDAVQKTGLLKYATGMQLRIQGYAGT